MGALEEGLEFKRQNRIADAIQAFRLATQQHPEDSTAWVHLGAMLQHDGQIDESISVFDQAIKANPSDPYGWEGKARSLMLRGLWADDREAIALCDRALALKGNMPEAYYVKGRLMAHSDDERTLRAAIATLDRAISLNPSHAEALTYKASALAMLKRFDEALDPAQRATVLNPRIILAWRILATSYWMRRQFVPADQAIMNAIQLDPNQAESHIVRGGILRNAWAFSRQPSDLENAIAEFNWALRLDPSSRETRKALDECFRDRRSASGGGGGSGLLTTPLLASAWLISSMACIASLVVGSGQQGVNLFAVVGVLSGLLAFGAWIGILVLAARQQRWVLFILTLIAGLVLTPIGLGLLGWLTVLFGKRK